MLCGLSEGGDELHAALGGDEDAKMHRRTRLIIRNLPWSCTEEKLSKTFHKFGSVTEVKIPKKADGRMRGFGFVQFSHGHESAKAIKGVQQIDGRKVAIDWSLPREVYEAEKAKDAPKLSEEVNHISPGSFFVNTSTIFCKFTIVQSFKIEFTGRLVIIFG